MGHPCGRDRDKWIPCHHGAGTWYQRDALRVLKRAQRWLVEGSLDAGDGILLFEADGDLLATAVVGSWEPGVGVVALVALHRDYHGAITPEGKFSRVVLATALEALRDAGHDRAVAEVAAPHGKSKALLVAMNFTFVSYIDDSAYELHGVDL